MNRGQTLFETLIVVAISALIGLMVYQEFSVLITGQTADIDANVASSQSRQSLDLMADHLRSGSACTNSAAGTLDSVLDAATATSVTYYGTSACAKVKYFLTNGTLSRLDNSVTTIVVRNVTSLTFTYYKAATYNAAWTTTTNPNAPTAAELPYVCGIQMDVVTKSSAVSNRVSTLVRLRNAPKKSNLNGL